MNIQGRYEKCPAEGVEKGDLVATQDGVKEVLAVGPGLTSSLVAIEFVDSQILETNKRTVLDIFLED